MSEPNRETLIALRSRRTAWQLVSAFLLGRRPTFQPPTCADCGRSFIPGERDDASAPRCAMCIRDRANRVRPRPPQPPHPFTPVRLPDFLMAKKR
jgi:hypothetical protein